ncbi:UNVERIFIED_CONTAM: cytochrome [Sesamum calycinum]|uniref:Cytochrome n=1 Tax=Sesamum calycinum TaxID=2727403 RepID=A0AAW2RW74_9LAMI
MKLTREKIKGFILDLFVGGTDTSAITIEWTLAELINHPKILLKAVQEIDSVVGKNRLVEESDIPNLPYLQAIFKESLRTHPDPNHWENPLEFRPERFLAEDGSAKGQLDVWGQHYQLLPSGSGRRSCPGNSLALLVVQTALAAMIQCFDWKVEGSVDMEEVPRMSLPRANPLICFPVPRLNPIPSL